MAPSRGSVVPPAATTAICSPAQEPKAGTPASNTAPMKAAAARVSGVRRCIWIGEPASSTPSKRRSRSGAIGPVPSTQEACSTVQSPCRRIRVSA